MQVGVLSLKCRVMCFVRPVFVFCSTKSVPKKENHSSRSDDGRSNCVWWCSMIVRSRASGWFPHGLLWHQRFSWPLVGVLLVMFTLIFLLLFTLPLWLLIPAWKWMTSLSASLLNTQFVYLRSATFPSKAVKGAGLTHVECVGSNLTPSSWYVKNKFFLEPEHTFSGLLFDSKTFRSSQVIWSQPDTSTGQFYLFSASVISCKTRSTPLIGQSEVVNDKTRDLRIQKKKKNSFDTGQDLKVDLSVFLLGLA